MHDFQQDAAAPDKLLVLLAGQSNMSGRGYAGPDDLTEIPRLLSLRPDGKWTPAIEPVTKDRPFVGTFAADGTKVTSPDPWDNILPPVDGQVVGVGPGRTFGRLLCEANPGKVVGLIPTAVGGTAVSAWVPGAADPCDPSLHPYDDALYRARVAQQSGKIVAILWHQGETDASEQTTDYKRKLRQIIMNFRRDLALDDSIPFIAGELGNFYGPNIQNHIEIVDQALRELAAELPFFRLVPTKDLQDRGDQLHFDTASQHEFGQRCFAAYQQFLR